MDSLSYEPNPRTSIWVVSAGEGGQYSSKFEDRGFVAIGYYPVGNVDGLDRKKITEGVATEPRIRREVVDQILDYAANTVVHGPVETMRAEFETHHEEPQQVIAEFLSGTETDEEFWRKAKTNLQAGGRCACRFVADEIISRYERAHGTIDRGSWQRNGFLYE